MRDRWNSIKESILTKQNELEVLNAYSDASFAVKDAKSAESWKKYKLGFEMIYIRLGSVESHLSDLNSVI